MKCSHCQQNFPAEAMIFEGGLAFCCSGCAGVFRIICGAGLADFYERAERLEPAAPVANSFIPEPATQPDGSAQIRFSLLGAHCAACAWLCEKFLAQNPAVLAASVHPATFAATVRYDPRGTDAAELIAAVASLGYAAAAPFDSAAEQRFLRGYYARLIVAIACLANIMWIAVAKYAGAFGTLARGALDALNFAEFLLCSPVLLYCAAPLFRSALAGARARTLNMDFLICTASVCAYAYSCAAMLGHRADTYFDSVCMLLCFIFFARFAQEKLTNAALRDVRTLGGWLAGSVRRVGHLADDLADGDLAGAAVNGGAGATLAGAGANSSVQPVNPQASGELGAGSDLAGAAGAGSEAESVPAAAVQIGDLIEVKTGERVLIDGDFVRGCALLDESFLTGESEPKAAAGAITSGALCSAGSFVYRARCRLADGRLAAIDELLSHTRKSRTQDICERAGAAFSALVLALAAAAWALYGDVARAIATLIVACPCALTLSAPLAGLLAAHRALRLGVLLKTSDFLPLKIRRVALDKTGTIAHLRVVNDFAAEFAADGAADGAVGGDAGAVGGAGATLATTPANSSARPAKPQAPGEVAAMGANSSDRSVKSQAPGEVAGGAAASPISATPVDGDASPIWLRRTPLRSVSARPVGDLTVLAALANASTHPVSAAVVAALREQNLFAPAAVLAEEIPAVGVRAEFNGAEYFLGNSLYINRNARAREYAAELTAGKQTAANTAETAAAAQLLWDDLCRRAKNPTEIEHESSPWEDFLSDGANCPQERAASTVFAKNGRVLATIRLAQEPTPQAAAAIAAIRSRYELAILSGDAPQAVAQIARQLGIAAAHARSTPEQKAAAVDARTLFIGDGHNDAPALRRAALSLAIARGSELAIAHADGVFLRGHIGALPALLALIARTRRIIWQNLAVSLAYNLAFIPAAFAGAITPLAAAALMSASSLCVVGNSMRILRGDSLALAGDLGAENPPKNQTNTAQLSRGDLRGCEPKPSADRTNSSSSEVFAKLPAKRPREQATERGDG